MGGSTFHVDRRSPRSSFDNEDNGDWSTFQSRGWADSYAIDKPDKQPGDWLAYDFGQETTVARMELTFKTNKHCPSAASLIQTSSDGVTWTDVATVPDMYIKLSTNEWRNARVDGKLLSQTAV